MSSTVSIFEPHISVLPVAKGSINNILIPNSSSWNADASGTVEGSELPNRSPSKGLLSKGFAGALSGEVRKGFGSCESKSGCCVALPSPACIKSPPSKLIGFSGLVGVASCMVAKGSKSSKLIGSMGLS